MELNYAINPQSLFRKYAKDLLWMANTEAGKYLIGANPKERITKVFHNGYEIYLGKRGENHNFVSRFSTWSSMEKIFIPLIEKIKIAQEYNDEILRKIKEDKYSAFLHFSGLQRNKYLPSIYLTIETFTANGGGQGRVGATNATYLTAHDAASGTKDSGVTRPMQYTSFEINRGFAPFDSSALPDNATIVSGANTFIRCLVTGKDDADADSVSVVASTQASNTALVGDDFDQVGTTKFITDVLIANITTAGAPGSANSFQLNASGITNISLTGYSKFAWRTAKDISATAPTVGNNNIQMVDDTNLLSVEYTLPSGVSGYKSLLGVGQG